MTKRTWWARKHWHPSERDLLLYVNGEGGSKLAPSVRDHLEGCWSCSMKRDRITGAISAFMRAREAGLDGEGLSEGAGRRFESKLRRRAEKAEREHIASKRENPSRSRHGVPLQAALAVSLFAVTAALVWLRFSSVPSVSAREILSRAERAESMRIGAVNAPVVHQLLHVTRRVNGLYPESAYLETWRDTLNNRWKQETKEAVAVAGGFNSKGLGSRRRSREGDPRWVAELEEVLKSNNMHQNPMSASAFAGWRSRLKTPVESITETLLENGDKALTIATTAAETLPKNAITKAEFVVRRQDWHPVEQRLSVSEPVGFRSYEIRETSFEVVALGSLGASIFEQPVLPAPLALQSSSLDRPLAAESQTDALELEIALFHRLHQAGACLGEEVRVVRGASAKPEVRGIVESLERKQELTRLFAEFPGVPVVIQAVSGEEKAVLAANSGTSEAPAADAASIGTEGDSEPSPMKNHLVAHFARLDLPAEARRPRMVEFSNQVISLSQSAHLHGWALRRLAERFNDVHLEKLSPQAVARFRSMANDHLRALSSVVGRCDEMLRPVLASLANAENAENRPAEFPATEAGNWQSRSMRVFESVMKADRLIHSLFAGTEATANLQESSSALLVSLPLVLEDTRAAESKLSVLVSVPGQPVISAQSNQQPTP